MPHAPGGERPASDPVRDFKCVDAWAPQAKEVAAISYPVSCPISCPVAADTITDPALPLAPVAAPSPAATLDLMAHDILLAQDIVTIEHAQKMLAAVPGPKPLPVAAAATIAERRTSDSVPIVLGSVLGALMLVVFSFAALFAKMAR